VVGNSSPDRRSELVGGSLAEAMPKQQVIPANNGILDEAVAGLGNLLFLFVSGAEFTWVANGDHAREAITEFDPVEYVLDRHAQFDIINVTEDEYGFDDAVERLESGISPESSEAAVSRHGGARIVIL